MQPEWNKSTTSFTQAGTTYLLRIYYMIYIYRGEFGLSNSLLLLWFIFWRCYCSFEGITASKTTQTLTHWIGGRYKSKYEQRKWNTSDIENSNEWSDGALEAFLSFFQSNKVRSPCQHNLQPSSLIYLLIALFYGDPLSPNYLYADLRNTEMNSQLQASMMF